MKGIQVRTLCKLASKNDSLGKRKFQESNSDNNESKFNRYDRFDRDDRSKDHIEKHVKIDKDDQPECTIDILTKYFRKTEASPPLFYLPLSNEDIEKAKEQLKSK